MYMSFLPYDLKLEMMYDGEGLEKSFTKHIASWHKNCRYKFSAIALENLKIKSSAMSKTDTEKVVSKCTLSTVNTEVYI